MHRLQRMLPGLVVAVLAWLSSLVVPLVSGAFWPIAVAPRIWHEHAVRFTTDAISALPVEGGSWVVQPWLPALVMWGSWLAGGATMLSVLNGLLAALAAWLGYRVARGYAGPLPAAATMLLVLPLLAPHTLKSQQFALVLMPALLLVLTTRAWPAAPLLVALWSNAHGSAPVGIALCGLAAVGFVRSRDAGGASVVTSASPLLGSRWRWRVPWLAACFAAALANPLGTGFIDYVTDVQEIPGLEALTPIWRPLDPTSWRGLWVLAIGAMLVLGVVRLRDAYPWPPLRAGLRRLVALHRPGHGIVCLAPVVLFGAMAFDAQRNVVWLAIALLPELAMVLGRAWQAVRLPVDLDSPIVAVTIAAALAFGVVGLFPGNGLQHRLALQAQPPERLIAPIERGSSVFASAEWADYLRVRRGVTVFVDARLERYRRDDLEAYLDATERGTASKRLMCFGDRGWPSGDGEPPYGYVLVRSRTGQALRDSLRVAYLSAEGEPSLLEVAHDADGSLFRIECPGPWVPLRV